MGLIGVDGRGWRYSGCKMCPARAASIFKIFIGRRFACREGSEGETEWTKTLLFLSAPFFPDELLSQAGLVLFLRKETVGDVIMTQFSLEIVNKSSDGLEKGFASDCRIYHERDLSIREE